MVHTQENLIPADVSWDVIWRAFERVETLLRDRVANTKSWHVGTYLASESGRSMDSSVAEMQQAASQVDPSTIKSMNLDVSQPFIKPSINLWYRSRTKDFQVVVEAEDLSFAIGWVGAIKAEIERALAETPAPPAIPAPTVIITAPVTPLPEQKSVLERPWVTLIGVPVLLIIIAAIVGLTIADVLPFLE